MAETVKPYPRKENPYTRNGKPVVAKIPHNNGDYLYDSLVRAIEIVGGLEKSVKNGDHVLLKPNFNCSYPTPLSTNLDFLGAVIEVLQDAGCIVTVGELSGRADWPTEEVIRKLGVMRVLHRHNVPFVNFQYDEWVTLDVGGTGAEYWSSFRVPRTIYEADKRIYLPNMRTHSAGGYSGAMKLAVGWIDLDDRDKLHAVREEMQPRAVELNLGWQPELIIMDCRRCTTGWQGRGDYVFPGCFMASGDMVAIDAEGVKILKRFPDDNYLKDKEVEEIPQIVHARKLGLGSMDYELIEAEAHSATEQQPSMLKDPALLAEAALREGR